MARYLGIEVTDTLIKGALLERRTRSSPSRHLRGLSHPGARGARAGRARARGHRRGAVEHPRRQAAGARRRVRGAPGHRRVAARDLAAARGVSTRRQSLTAELEGAVPFDIDDAMVDAQVIRGRPGGLLAAAVLTARVESFVAALASAGIDPREVGVAPVALTSSRERSLSSRRLRPWCWSTRTSDAPRPWCSKAVWSASRARSTGSPRPPRGSAGSVSRWPRTARRAAPP